MTVQPLDAPRPTLAPLTAVVVMAITIMAFPLWRAAAEADEFNIEALATQLTNEGITGLTLPGDRRVILAEAMAACSGVTHFVARDLPHTDRQPYLEQILSFREVAVLLSLPVLSEDGLTDYLAVYEQVAVDNLQGGAAVEPMVDWCDQLGVARDAALDDYRTNAGNRP